MSNVIQFDSTAPATRSRDAAASHDEALRAASHAGSTIAPLWPLKNFVAVNPFIDLSAQPFADSIATVKRIWDGRLLMPRSFYRSALDSGRIGDDDLAVALSLTGSDSSLSIAELRALAAHDEPVVPPAPTLAEVLAERDGRNWPEFIVDRISTWAAAYFDEGQATWRSPWRGLSPYAAWRSEATLDRTPEIMGVAGFRGAVAGLPEDPGELLAATGDKLGLSPDGLEAYFSRLLATIGGWAGHARYQGWHNELAGRSDSTVRDLLAIRTAWDVLLFECMANEQAFALWRERRERLSADLPAEVTHAHRITLVLHTAYEVGGRRPFLQALGESAHEQSADSTSASVTPLRPDAQAVFCIDVRSERYRRALETTHDGIETLGFAGFFGFAIEVADIDQTEGGAQCPVLLAPQFLIREGQDGAAPQRLDQLARQRSTQRGVAGAWKAFAGAAVSSFAFVEALGLTYAWRLVANALGVDDRSGAKRQSLSIEQADLGERMSGIGMDQRVAVAKGALQGMSLREGFAPIVALIGHGSTTANNPYASRLNCGACGGHTGEANARVAAAVLNDPLVRSALALDGIRIPSDTHFVAGLHDTATDEVALLDTERVPAALRPALDEFRAALVTAGRQVRAERAATFGIDSGASIGATDAAMIARSRDWSEVRPEWGLAGCAAFVAAPRARTSQADLSGRSFLHNYRWQDDQDFAVLELIMTAPLVVATWISLQYYASTVDNRTFGSGEKTLHNVVGGLGVLEGNGGDLRVGLPEQSLHDGTRFVHEPMRLNAFLEAPVDAINGVFAKHASVRQLADNGWIHVFAVLDEGRTIMRYDGDLSWSEASADVARRPRDLPTLDQTGRRSNAGGSV